MQDTLEHDTMHIYGMLLLRDELWNARTIVVNDKHILLVYNLNFLLQMFVIQSFYFVDLLS